VPLHHHPCWLVTLPLANLICWPTHLRVTWPFLLRVPLANPLASATGPLYRVRHATLVTRRARGQLQRRSNTAKAAENKKIPFAYYYCDFSLGVFASAAIAFVTLGAHQISGDGNDAAYSLHDRDTLYKFLSAVGAGAVFNVANLLLVVAIQIAGLSISFPIAIGTALVLGTVLTYFIDENGDPIYLFSGESLLLLVLLVCFSPSAL
jgi:hypothetical protein